MSKCRDCVHLERDLSRSYCRCMKGRWSKRGAEQWYSVNTLRRNRHPIREYGLECPDYQTEILGMGTWRTALRCFLRRAWPWLLLLVAGVALFGYGLAMVLGAR